MLKNKLNIKFLVSLFFLSYSLNVFSGINDGDIEGFYVPKRGWSEAHELHPGENVGQHWVSLKSY